MTSARFSSIFLVAGFAVCLAPLAFKASNAQEINPFPMEPPVLDDSQSGQAMPSGIDAQLEGALNNAMGGQQAEDGLQGIMSDAAGVTANPFGDGGLDAYVDAQESEGQGADPFAGGRQPGFDLNIRRSREQAENAIRQDAFNAAINGFLPLRPDEIRRFLEIYDETRQAANVPVVPYPEPENEIITVSLDPSTPPPVIYLAKGHVTTLSLLDVTGTPWPIGQMTWAGDFEVVVPQEGENVLRITPLSDYAYGNVSITFPELVPPVVFILKSGRERVHMRFDANIPRIGPYSTPPLIDNYTGPTAVAGDIELVTVLDGTQPQGSEILDVSGTDSRTKAYRLNDMIYVRTPLTLISPAWMSSARSADGLNVYQLQDAPVILLSERGQVRRVFLKSRATENAL